MGCSDLGWAMRKIFGQSVRWAANFLVCPRLGHQTKTHACLLQKIKILTIKVNKTIQIIKCKWCYWSYYFVYTTTRSGRITAVFAGKQLSMSSLVELRMSIQCRVYLQCSYLQVFFIIIIKVYFPNLDWVGHENFFVRLPVDGLWNCYLHAKRGHQTYWQNLWFTSSPP
jgi:hypothetical protein